MSCQASFRCGSPNEMVPLWAFKPKETASAKTLPLMDLPGILNSKLHKRRIVNRIAMASSMHQLLSPEPGLTLVSGVALYANRLALQTIAAANPCGIFSYLFTCFELPAQMSQHVLQSKDGRSAAAGSSHAANILRKPFYTEHETTGSSPFQPCFLHGLLGGAPLRTQTWTTH